MLEQAKQNMIQNQLRPFGITDTKILNLMAKIPREKFVPTELQQLAYSDISLPIGQGQWLMAPKEIARVLQALDINKNEKILLIGVESGYLAALLSQLGKQVYILDKETKLTTAAEKKIMECGIKNVSLLTDQSQLEKESPFQVIFISGSLPAIPKNLQKNLGRNGRIFVIIGKNVVMTATILKRENSQWKTVTLFETKHPPLSNASFSEEFIF